MKSMGQNTTRDSGLQKLSKELSAESGRFFHSPLSEFIYYRTYSRWIEAEGRRETWVETVDRYLDFLRENLGDRVEAAEVARIRQGILEQKVMPSMRLLWSAGKAARASHVAAYNCAYIAPTGLRDLAEIMYLLMCGTGVGFSVEAKHVQKFPAISPQCGKKKPVHQVEDSREGWGNALLAGIEAWFSGMDQEFDLSLLRPAGARLLTMGGRSSGPEPLRVCLQRIRARVLSRQGGRLQPLDLHDIICSIGEAIVMGGVRRAALLSLSDLQDADMREAKKGRFFDQHPERAMANNSTAYDAKPAWDEFFHEWQALQRSGSGERGIFNRGSLECQLPERRWPAFAPDSKSCGTNPCGEIVLKSKQFCNLTEVVARSGDGEKELLEKIELAAILGTYQATLTDFPYLSSDWQRHCEEERLLGVSLTGLWDCPALQNSALLEKLRLRAVEVNQAYAQRFGIRAAAAVTCIKPSGTVSQLVDSASGMHPRYARFYIRRVRISTADPLFEMLRKQGYPSRPETGQAEMSAAVHVLDFPVAAPEGAVTRADLSALAQLEHWLKVKKSFTEHNPSITIHVKDEEWEAVARWVYDHWENVGGLAFLPTEQTVYELAPYEEITRERYEEMVASLPKVDFSAIVSYEKDDRTSGASAIACLGDACELDPVEQ
jgi:ribonucleoside-triphosphate reductase (thioredoxin)